MIFVDMSQVVISKAQSDYSRMRPTEFNEAYLRHSIVNRLREINVKFRRKYGEMVLCCDSKHYWRKDVFEHYKANRKKARSKSKFPWTEFHEYYDKIKLELVSNFPYKIIEVYGAEGDDIIGTLVPRMCAHEPCLIVSADGDFQQLQQYPNVEQWVPKDNKMLKCENPTAYMREHIIRGDTGDGIPNVFSKSDTLVTDGARQTSIMSKDVPAWLEMTPSQFIEKTGISRERYELNEQLILLKNTPDELKQKIIEFFENVPRTPRSKIINYLMKHRMKLLIEHLPDF